MTVDVLPYSVNVAHTITYLSCYYHISGEKYNWEDGAKLKIMVNKVSDVNLYLLGGNSRENASIAIIDNNATMVAGTTYEIDISTEAILVAVPVANKQTGSYSFTYEVSGSEYSWWQKLIHGPDGELYFWIAIGCAAGIGALFLAIIIVIIVKCCRRSSKIKEKGNDATYDYPTKDPLHKDFSSSKDPY